MVSLTVKRGKIYILVKNKYCGEHKKEKTGWRSSFQGEPGAVLSEGPISLYCETLTVAAPTYGQ